MKIAKATSVGFLIMGFVGFLVKIIHIPINNILVRQILFWASQHWGLICLDACILVALKSHVLSSVVFIFASYLIQIGNMQA